MVRLTVDSTLPALEAVFLKPFGGFHVDLSNVTFIDPYGLVSVLSRAHAAQRQGLRVTASPPKDFQVSSYCQRVGLFSVLRELGPACSDPHPEHARHPQGNWMAECQEVADTSDVHAVDNVLLNLLDEVDWPPDITERIGHAFYEVCDNLITHALVEHGYGVMQALPNAKRCQVAAGDAGVGIPFHHPEADDAASIVRALEKGVTSQTDKGRGKGFALMMRLLAEVGGTLTVRSGAGKVVVPPGGEPHKMITWPLDGTVVAIDVPLGR